MTVTRQIAGIVLLGHVDHGKSTIVGRLLAETGTLSAAAIPELERVSRRRGMPFEWSFALDSLQAERNQAITIGSTQVRLRVGGSEVLLIDAPGHEELLAHMISGAAQARAAVLVVDVSEGIRGQSRRHAYLANFLGIRQFVIAVNKLDLVGFEESPFRELERTIIAEFGQLSLPPPLVVPVAARDGDNLTNASTRTPWYTGPTLLQTLLVLGAGDPVSGPLRLPIQDVYKFGQRRILVGRVESGRLSIGDTLLFSPSGRVARVKTIEEWNRPTVAHIDADDVVGFTLDAQVLVQRGDVASHVADAPLLTTEFRAHIIWFGERPLFEGHILTLKTGTAETTVIVDTLEDVFDLEALTPIARVPPDIASGEAGWVRCKTRTLLPLDAYAKLPLLGRFVLMDEYRPVGAGLVDLTGCDALRRRHAQQPTHVASSGHEMSSGLRAQRYGHTGAVFWLTGLSGAGKSTIAMGTEWELFQRGYYVYVLDGDNLRRGINADLRFSAQDRRENIRRAGELSALFADAGLVVLAAFISPSARDRAMARFVTGAAFHEVYVHASLATCEARDPKGLYQAARAGEIPEFTGVSAPYESPLHPDLEIDTEYLSIDESVEKLATYIDNNVSHSRLARTQTESSMDLGNSQLTGGSLTQWPDVACRSGSPARMREPAAGR